MSEISHMPLAPTLTEVKASGEVVERHHHDDHQLIYVSAGVISISTAHGTWVASRNRALWVPAHTWHEHRFHGRSVFHTVRVPVTSTPPLSTDSPVVVNVDPLLRELLIAYTAGHSTNPGTGTASHQPHRLQADPDTRGRAARDRAARDREARRMFRVILDRLQLAPPQALVLPTPIDPRLVVACHAVEADLGRTHALGRLASRANVSTRTLSRLFQLEFGMTYPQWRTRARILSAMVLLAEGTSVTRAAAACGWATTSAFVDTFTRTIGVTPGTYRAGVLAEHDPHLLPPSP